jgi:agmatinase
MSGVIPGSVPRTPAAPRYTGLRTFARLPHVELPRREINVAAIGVPFDTATSFRSGARFGPESIRSASMLLRPYHPDHAIDVFGALSAVDGGDIEITPGNARRSAEQIAGGCSRWSRRGSCRSCSAVITRSCSASFGPTGLASVGDGTRWR